jgi:hypothetical protein
VPDVTPNWHLEQQRLRAQIAQQQATIEAQRLAIMEMDDRKSRNEENITAALAAILNYQEQLDSLEATHGPLESKKEK